MRLPRTIVPLLGIAVLLLVTGDCVNLLFADSQAMECCLRGECPLSQQDAVDSCCKIPNSDSGKYIQDAGTVSLSQPAVGTMDWPSTGSFESGAGWPDLRAANVDFHAPPGLRGNISLPLLI